MNKNPFFFIKIEIKRLHVFTNSCDYVVAYDPQDAAKVYEETTGDEYDDWGGNEPFYKEDDREKFSISAVEEDQIEEMLKNRPLFSVVYVPEAEDGSFPGFPGIKAPCWAWALKNGRGWLASSEW